jgi:hypothetical protein
MERYERENTERPKIPLSSALGRYTVTAAITREIRTAGDGLLAQSWQFRDSWLGSTVVLSKTAIEMTPRDPQLVMRPENLQNGELYPKCTKPEFDADLRNSASPMAEFIDVWKNFGLEAPERGRYYMIRCHGELEFPDDPSGHVAEITVEEADGPVGLYIYDPNHIIVEWGALQFLLTRKAA